MTVPSQEVWMRKHWSRGCAISPNVSRQVAPVDRTAPFTCDHVLPHYPRFIRPAWSILCRSKDWRTNAIEKVKFPVHFRWISGPFHGWMSRHAAGGVGSRELSSVRLQHYQAGQQLPAWSHRHYFNLENILILIHKYHLISSGNFWPGLVGLKQLVE